MAVDPPRHASARSTIPSRRSPSTSTFHKGTSRGNAVARTSIRNASSPSSNTSAHRYRASNRAQSQNTKAPFSEPARVNQYNRLCDVARHYAVPYARFKASIATDG